MRYRIAIGSDHGGLQLKKALVALLARRRFIVLDMGVSRPNCDVDYPDYALAVALAVARKKADLGVLCCGTGIGMSIAANKIRGIRAAVVWNRRSAALAREHNAANILCLGGRLLTLKGAQACLEAFLRAQPSRESRHSRRIAKISRLERGLR